MSLAKGKTKNRFNVLMCLLRKFVLLCSVSRQPIFLGNKTCLILGLGRVGVLTADILLSMGVTVLATDVQKVKG
jgi:phosphoglycerate dehydrogenase-like enzyme